MKLNRMSEVAPRRSQADSVKQQKAAYGSDRARALAVLHEAQAHYSAMERFRQDRERCKAYCYGDQWSDPICYGGKLMSEREYLIQQGNLPLKNNLTRRLVNNVIGVWSSQSSEPTCIARDRDEQKLGEMMSTMLQYNMQLNRMNVMYARSLEDFLIGGLVVHKKWYGWRDDKMECWTEYVQPNSFFVDSNMRDFSGRDCSIVGEIHDISFEDLCSHFAKSQSDYDRLAEIYRSAADRDCLRAAWDDFGYSKERDMSFLTPHCDGRCRVIEVWRKERKPRWRCVDWNTGDLYKIEIEDRAQMVEGENARRTMQGMEAGMAADDIPLITAEWFVDEYWYCYYLSPMGDILQEGETPYEHKSHPYVFAMYPFIDGEVHSFVADTIDQQKYVNRLVTLYDWIIRASAKGVLMVPEDCIPEGTSLEDFAESWSSVNGILVYKPNNTGQAPQQVSSNATNIGISEMLNLQLKFFEDISGVNGALQGKPGYSGISAALYSQQTQNATTSLLGLLNTFNEFTKDAAYKDVKNIQQFYGRKKQISIAGRRSVVEYDPEKIRDVEFDLSIVPSTATPAYRAMANDFLMQIWQAGQITLQQLLEAGSFPFADELLQSISVQQEQMAQGQAPQGLPPQLAAQARQGADMGAVAGLGSALAGGGAPSEGGHRVGG